MVFQNYALYPHMTVFDNMAFGLKLQKVPKHEIDERVREAARHPRPRRAARPQAGRALRRPAAAGRDGSGDRAPPAGVPDGRAAVEPRREAARADAVRDRADPARPRRHDDLRHPRPDRGDDDGRPRRRHPQGACCSRSTRRRRSTSTRRNLFVAGFIGSPAMNLFEATLRHRRTARRPSNSAASACRCPEECSATRPGAARATPAARSCSASVPRTWRTRRSCPTRRPSGGSASSIELARGARLRRGRALHDPRRCRAHRRRQELAVDVGPRGLDGRARAGSHTDVVARLNPRTPARKGEPDRAGRRHPSPALLRSRRRLGDLRQDQLTTVSTRERGAARVDEVGTHSAAVTRWR